MCQLLGMSSRAPATIDVSLEGFRARGGLTDHHRDGWGIAFFQDQHLQLFTEELPAATSRLLDRIKQQSNKAQVVLAHIRKATFGEVNARNCHPFKRELWGRSWVFTHNGDLPGFDPLLTGRFVPEGETDSERAFCYLLDRLASRFPRASRNQPPSDVQLHAALRELSYDIAQYGTFNFMLTNGDWLFTHCSTHLAYVERSYPFGRVTLVDGGEQLDLDAHHGIDDRMVVIATKPLTHEESWTGFQPGETCLFRASEVIASGPAHAQEPVPNRASRSIQVERQASR